MYMSNSNREFFDKQLDRDIARKSEDLKTALSTLQRRIAEAFGDLAEGRKPNGAGIVQNLGNEVDRLNGELHALLRIREYWRAE